MVSYPGEKFLLTNMEISATLALWEMEQRERCPLEEWEPLSEGSGIWGSWARAGLIGPQPLRVASKEREGPLTADGTQFRKEQKQTSCCGVLVAQENSMGPSQGTMGQVCPVCSQLIINAQSND